MTKVTMAVDMGDGNITVAEQQRLKEVQVLDPICEEDKNSLPILPYVQSSSPALSQILAPVSPFTQSCSITGNQNVIPIPTYVQSSPPAIPPYVQSSPLAWNQNPKPICQNSSIAGSQIPVFPQSVRSFPPPGSQIQTPIYRYASYLRDRYKCQLPTEEWPPPPCKEIIQPVFTEKREGLSRPEHDLDMFEQMPMGVHKKSAAQEISFSEILKSDGSNLKCVMVEGVPGIGKSVFAWKLCQEWVEGNQFKEFDLVIQQKMNEKNVQEAKKIGDIFEHDHSELQEQVTKEVIRRDGKGVLLLFEMVDEPSLKLITNNGSFLRAVFSGSKLPEANVLIICRPWAAKPLHQVRRVSRHLELLGFTEDGISQYISCAFPDEHQRAEFKEYLSLWSFAKTMMNVPLITAIVIQVYQSHKKIRDQPKTLTELYKALVKALLLTYIEDHSEECDEVPEDLEDLESFPSPIRDHFHYLCELAYTGINKNTADKGEEVRNFPKSSLPKNFNPIGLMRSSTNLYADGKTVLTYSFHSTLQEFLAAYHLSLQTEEDQRVFFKEHALTHHSDIIVGFLCGLSKFSASLLQSLEPPADSETCKTHQLSMGNKVCYLRWLYEAQKPEVCSTKEL